MREIKFRAWIKTKNGLNMYPVGVFNKKVFVRTTIPYYGDAFVPLTEEYGELEAVMQYTGLKDTNGKEIYEGDIIKWGHINGYEENPHRIAIVEFNPDIQLNCINLEFIFRYGCFNYQNTDEAVEVIGNIYENPELIADNVEE